MFVEPSCWYLSEWVAYSWWWPATFGSWSILDEDTLRICPKLAAGEACLAEWRTRFRKLTNLELSRVQSKAQALNGNGASFFFPSCEKGNTTPTIGGYWEDWWEDASQILHKQWFFSPLTSATLHENHFRVRVSEICRERSKLSSFRGKVLVLNVFDVCSLFSFSTI